jgi:large conductance mechanosensitive channel
MSILGEFKTFISRGNVLDLAVGVIIGAAFGKIVSSLTEDIIMPVIGVVSGGVDFTNKFVVLGSIPANYTGAISYDALKKAGVAMFGYGAFITATINFLILAFIIFLIIKAANKLLPKPDAAPPGPSEVELLTQIRDELMVRPQV